MTLQIEARHNLSPNEIDAIEDRLYEHNSRATGRHDGQGLGFVIRDDAGRMIGVAAGYTWAGISELKQMWIDEAYRGCGYARALLNAFVAEACSRGVRRIWVSSYDFQSPKMYEKAGFKRMAEFEGWPEGHVNVVLCKTLSRSES
jgi:N-acetylglutamate synthase-like GNAT family acetyltransferase